MWLIIYGVALLVGFVVGCMIGTHFRNKMVKSERAVLEARELLATYLGEFPEHDPGDYRVYQAREILYRAILTRKPKK